MRSIFYCTLFSSLLIFNGCCRPSHRCHWLYDYIPAKRQDVGDNRARWLAWALLGNDDDGIFGEKIIPPGGALDVSQAVLWQIRNPLHNFCFYVIGSADRHNPEWDLLKITPQGICLMHYHDTASTVFADPRSSFYFGLHGNKPFLSLRLCYLPTRQFDFYIGWRERGNFGIKFLPFKKTKHQQIN